MSLAGFSYADARLHARLAARMRDADWQALETALDFAHALELAARLPVAHSAGRLDRTSTVHAVETALRAEFTAQLMEIAGWLPQRWRRAAASLIDLPFLRKRAYAVSGEAWPDWLDLGATGEIGPPQSVLDDFHRHLPRRSRTDAVAQVIDPLVQRYVSRSEPGPAPDWSALETHFIKQFRSNRVGPVPIFAYLGLVMLDGERLRGILVTHAVFARGPDA